MGGAWWIDIIDGGIKVYNRLFSLVVVSILIFIGFIPSVTASELTRKTKDFSDYTIPNVLSPIANETIVHNSTDAENYTNFNFSNMDNVFGENGKYIYSLTPPIRSVLPVNQSYFVYGTRFKLSDKIYGGVSNMWFRLPFYPYSNDSDYYGTINIRLYRLASQNAELRNVTRYGPVIYGTNALIYNYSMPLYTDNAVYHLADARFYNHTIEGNRYDFIWINVNSAIYSDNQYVLYINYTPSIPPCRMTYYLTQGDSFSDNIFDTALLLSSNNDTSISLDCDLDIPLFIYDILHNGRRSLRAYADNQVIIDLYGGLFHHDVNNSILYIKRYNGALNTGMDTYNIVFPIWCENQTPIEINVSYYFRYMDGSNNQFDRTYNVSGENFILDNFDVDNNKDIYYLRMIINSNNSINKWGVFLSSTQEGTEHIQDRQGNFTTYLGRHNDSWLNDFEPIWRSTLSLYGYFSLDDFTLDVQSWEPAIIPYNWTDNRDLLLERIQSWVAEINYRDEELATRLSFSKVIYDITKLGLIFISIPLKLMDSIIHATARITDRFGEYVNDFLHGGSIPGGDSGPLAALFDGITTIFAFILEIIKWVVDYGPYILNMVTHLAYILFAIVAGLVVFNGIYSLMEGLRARDPITALAHEFETTYRYTLIVLSVVSFIVGIYIGLINLIVPF